MEDSIYTKIIKGEIPCHKLYEDEHVIVILDIYPLTPGHTLVIPKQQIDHLWDLPDDLYMHVWKIAKHTVAPALQAAFTPKRVAVIVEGFGVPHAHIHLIPINQPDELKAKQDMTIEPNHEVFAQQSKKIQEKIDAK